MMAASMTLDEAVAHLGGKIGGVPDHVRDSVRDELPHYLWVMTDLDSRRRRYVFCEWCEGQRAEVKTGSSWINAYRQGERIACPYCGGDVTVKRMGRGFANIYDRINVVWYQKSAVDPNAVVAIGAHCYRDFAGCEERPWQNDPMFSYRSFTVIVPGRGSFRFKQEVTKWELWGGDHRTWKPDKIRWIPVKRFRGLTFGSTGANLFQHVNPLRVVVLDETLREAIRGTTLERGWSDEYLDDDSDGSVAMGLIAKYPCVEYMTKLGMTEMVKAKAEGDFRDYWNLCERFGEDLNDDAIAFPSNVHEAEARMRARERRENEILRETADKRTKQKQDDMIAKQYRRLMREYGFSFGGLTLRPARDGDEVRNEGKALHHCVGGYVNSYAEGRTIICVLRRDVEPAAPWRTVEISPTGRMVQDRGYHNDTTLGTPLTKEYSAMLALFWEAWGERHNKTEAKSA